MEPMEKKDQRTPNQGEGAVPSSPRKKRILLCCLAAAVLVIGYTALCAGAGRETIYPNVTVNGVNLGGLTQEAAQTALEEAGGPGRPAGDAGENQGVVFTAQTVEGESKTYQVPLASVTPDSVASTQRAWQVGHADPFPLRGGIYLRCLLSGEEVLPAYQGGESLDSILDQVEADLARDPVEPTWETDDTTLHLTRGTPGSRLDREALQGQILDTLGRSDMVELTAEAQPQFTVTLQQTLPGELDLADILSQVETPVQNAAFDKAAKIFQTDHPGISFDAAAAQTAYDGLDWGATQDFPLDITQPTTTVDDLTPKLYQDVLGSCSTNISGSTNRVENIRRIAEVSKLFLDSGIITIAAFISPNNDIREMAANIIGKDDFLEIFVSTPLEECEKRDVKGLYAKARKGEIRNFTGISAPFEVPEHPALSLDTSKLTLEESVNCLLELVLPKVKRSV